MAQTPHKRRQKTTDRRHAEVYADAFTNDAPYAYPAANDAYFDKKNTPSNPTQKRSSVQNVRRTSKNQRELYGDRTVSGGFRKSRNATAKKRGVGPPTASTTAGARRHGRLRRGVTGKKRKRGRKHGVETHAGSIKPGMWLGLGVAFMIYIWQFWFSVYSLVGYVSEAGIIYFQEETWVGSAVGLLVDLKKWFPGDDLGLIFFILNAVLVASAFAVFYILFRIRGINPHATASRFLVTVGCLLMSVLPVASLFPWLMVWILYMGTRRS